ncbi:hypothetical protein [Lactiplantibacillus mudanjiangensis]|uniref:Uncharacterized protein n=1 Tax=Lactiplantibacillus mudanjiangensis TaxID=1296538 RepID=A0A660E3H9_9LACO|nr:hypothetical protein [Lactiplantibacillus mudanjiangensis]VDG18578.1 hypothetical protein MUDAN_BIHEEGNE_03418 [Lactiplantibacillus mudanjiangensis]VDG24202.1 hypothetical protein MUDAN_IGPPGNFN_02471 [Lactiplantibacillus mudanjiangensis]VDG30180.1 hypothetical protein MUDAN_MDHGFNIF_01733 [Lactiplantibacillus mudanjiangensis]
MYDLKTQLISDRDNYELANIKNQIVNANRDGQTAVVVKCLRKLKSEFIDYLRMQGIASEETGNDCEYRFTWYGLLIQNDKEGMD